ncbi:MAG: pyrimidine-nucleoside phosphorylase [Clostridia bacterium]|nr:pyrimidine-nucleoside phosphorylase [Clostridia bacterium]
MRMVDLIAKKRRGEAHTDAEIDFIISGYVAGDIPDYQMSAWMMAVCWQGMEESEVSRLTYAMMYSGDVVDLGDLEGVKVDKHSTGGVGDTTTLVIAPLVAACGGTVAKMSGRGLGHTGGTLDKLESVPGVKVEKDIGEFKDIVRKNGLCVIGQSGNLVPADKLMYALRDVTGTVESIPLIASSIMSKKLAAGTDAIVLDVKTGTGAFMKTLEDARKLSETMVKIGNSLGRRTVAIMTDMDQPLGMAIGNGLEVKEAIDVLSGRVSESDPLYQVCMLLASNMLMVSGLAEDAAEAEAKLTAALKEGRGLAKLQAMLTALGAEDAGYVIAHPESLCRVRQKIEVTLEGEGYIYAMHAADIGSAAQMLGAGRAEKTDVIDPAVGLVMHRRMGDYVAAGEPIATMYVNDQSRLEAAMAVLRGAVELGPEKPASSPMIHGIVQ